jgi:hypothetical protein
MKAVLIARQRRKSHAAALEESPFELGSETGKSIDTWMCWQAQLVLDVPGKVFLWDERVMVRDSSGGVSNRRLAACGCQ